MINKHQNRNCSSLILLLLLITTTLACNSPTPALPPSPLITPTPMPAFMIRQWATDAVATSHYSDPDWSMQQATGPPNTAMCGDLVTAWAAYRSDTIETLSLFYDTPVHIREINIYQTFNPDQVVQVDLIDLQGNYDLLYSQDPQHVETPCPYILSIKTAQTDRVAQGIRLTIDQSLLGLGWNEIDAVELVGIPGRGQAIRPTLDPTPLLSQHLPPGVELYTNRADFEARLQGQINLVDFDDVDTSGPDPVLIKANRYQATAGIIISGEDGQYVDDVFEFFDDFHPVSLPNMYAPGPPASRHSAAPRGGHHTDITFSKHGQQAAVAGFGAVFIDTDYAGIGPSSLTVFDQNDQVLGADVGFTGPNGSHRFRGLITVDEQGQPIPAIFRVQLINGNEWPSVDVGEGVTLDDFVFGVPLVP